MNTKTVSAVEIPNGLPEEFGICDAVYMNPPSREEFDEFKESMGVTSGYYTYGVTVRAIDKMCLESKIPCFVLSNKTDFRKLKNRSGEFTVLRNGVEFVMVCYNIEAPRFGDGVTFESAMKWVIKKHYIIGNYCFGRLSPDVEIAVSDFGGTNQVLDCIGVYIQPEKKENRKKKAEKDEEEVSDES